MIYIDVDGVLADFHSHMESLSDHPDLWTDDDVIHQVMDDNYRVCFLDAEPLPNLKAFKDLYDENQGKVKLLTAYGGFWSSEIKKETAIQNKIQWIIRHGFKMTDMILVEKSGQKLPYCYPKDILYDDKWETIQEWRKLGGIGIWMSNGRQSHSEWNPVP